MKITLNNGTELGFDEVIDTLDDALVVTEKVHAAAQDGIGVGDIGTAFEITPLLNDIRQDAGTFAAQLADLTPAESDAVADALVARRGGSKDTIVQKALAGLQLASRWHDFSATAVVLVQDTIDFGRGIFKKAA